MAVRQHDEARRRGGEKPALVPRKAALLLATAIAVGCAVEDGYAAEDGYAPADEALPWAAAAPAVSVWAGSAGVVTVDAVNAYPANLSALVYEPARPGAVAVLWALLNGPTRLHRLVQRGAEWLPSAADGWASGKTLRFPTGSGTPDAEGLAMALPGADGVRFLYVASERANEGFTSRPSVLRYDVRAQGASLSATHEWNLTRDLPSVGANTGIEALAFVPDTALRDFLDESTSAEYDPARYAEHAGGVFFVGVEQTGLVYGYVLDHASGGARRIATIETGLAGVMGLDYDGASATLWAYCDDTCHNRAALLALDTGEASPTRGRFTVARVLGRPTGLPDANNEGIALTPDATCVNGEKPFFWAADGATGGHAIRQGSVACGRLF